MASVEGSEHIPDIAGMEGRVAVISGRVYIEIIDKCPVRIGVNMSYMLHDDRIHVIIGITQHVINWSRLFYELIYMVGKKISVDHGHGVVIGETTIIGDCVTLYQGVTLGGTGKEHGKRHPTVGNNVLIGAGAKVLGSITIGDNVKVGAGSVVINDIPSNTTVVGIPGRIVRCENVKVEVENLDQVDIPDPIEVEIEELRKENEELKRRITALEKVFAAG